MRVIILKDEDMEELIKSLELSKLRSIEHLGIHDPKRHEITEMHRTFHFHVVSWAQKHGYKSY